MLDGVWSKMHRAFWGEFFFHSFYHESMDSAFKLRSIYFRLTVYLVPQSVSFLDKHE